MDEDRVAERQAQLAVVERLLTAIRLMDGGRSLTDVLSALTSAAAAEAPRVALFVVNGSQLRGWKTIGFEMDTLQASLEDEGLLAEVMRRREPVVSAEGDGPSAPAFAALPSDRAAIAVPSWWRHNRWQSCTPTMRRRALRRRRPRGPKRCRFSAATRRSTSRTSPPPAPRRRCAARWRLRRRRHQPGRTRKEDGTSARRYARLLVSEIKLYNEAAVRLGRQKRDLLERLKPEIERARVVLSVSRRQSMRVRRSFNRSSCRRWPTAMHRSWAIPRDDPHVPNSCFYRHPRRRPGRCRPGPKPLAPPSIRPSRGTRASCGWCRRPRIVRRAVGPAAVTLAGAVRRYQDGDYAGALTALSASRLRRCWTTTSTTTPASRSFAWRSIRKPGRPSRPSSTASRRGPCR